MASYVWTSVQSHEASLVVFLPVFLTCGLRSVRDLDTCGQATKGARGMSWYQKAMKGVEVCEKPGGVDKRALILGCLNCSYAEYIGVWRLTR